MVEVIQTLQEFNIERLALVQSGLTTLLIWAVLNILLSFVGQAYSEGFKRQFFLMNGYWNIVNMALAIFGLVSTPPIRELTLLKTVEAQFNLERLLLFNSGLDIGYVILGFFLIQKSLKPSSKMAQLKGYGFSIILQGSWLFVFDLTFFYFLYDHGLHLNRFFKQCI